MAAVFRHLLQAMEESVSQAELDIECCGTPKKYDVEYKPSHLNKIWPRVR